MKLKPIFRGRKLVTKKQLKERISILEDTIEDNKKNIETKNSYIADLLSRDTKQFKMYEKEKKKLIEQINELQNKVDELQKKYDESMTDKYIVRKIKPAVPRKSTQKIGVRGKCQSKQVKKELKEKEEILTSIE